MQFDTLSGRPLAAAGRLGVRHRRSRRRATAACTALLLACAALPAHAGPIGFLDYDSFGALTGLRSFQDEETYTTGGVGTPGTSGSIYGGAAKAAATIVPVPGTAVPDFNLKAYAEGGFDSLLRVAEARAYQAITVSVSDPALLTSGTALVMRLSVALTGTLSGTGSALFEYECYFDVGIPCTPMSEDPEFDEPMRLKDAGSEFRDVAVTLDPVTLSQTFILQTLLTVGADGLGGNVADFFSTAIASVSAAPGSEGLIFRSAASPASVPEPATLALLAIAALGMSRVNRGPGVKS